MSDAIETTDAARAAQDAAEPDPFLSLKRGGTEIYFVRHGDALPDQDEVVLGDYDAQALSDLGRRQAQAEWPMECTSPGISAEAACGAA